MKKMFLLLSVFMLFAASSFANPPSDIKATYDSVRQELNVIVEHPVSNPKKHYIEKIDILQNGAQVFTPEFESQTSHRNQTITPVKLSVKSGDKILVWAKCNKFGTGETVIEIQP